MLFSSLCVRSLAVPPLPSASILVNMFNTLTGFTYRGLAPHKFTPMPGVHHGIQRIAKSMRPLMLAVREDAWGCPKHEGDP